MGLIDTAKQWLFGVALKKGIKAVVTLLLSWLASAKIAAILAAAGVTIDVGELTTWLTATLTGLFTIVLNWIKTKVPSTAKLL